LMAGSMAASLAEVGGVMLNVYNAFRDSKCAYLSFVSAYAISRLAMLYALSLASFDNTTTARTVKFFVWALAAQNMWFLAHHLSKARRKLAM